MTTQTSTLTKEQIHEQRISEIELSLAQELAPEMAKLAPMFATDPAEATKQMLQLQQSARAKAVAKIETEDKAKAEKAETIGKAVVAFRGQGVMDFQAVWNDKLAEQASKFPHIERWTFIIEKDTEKSTDVKAVFKDGTFVDGTVRHVRTGATSDTRTGGGAQVLKITGADVSKGAKAEHIGEYPSAKQANEKVLGNLIPKNRTQVISALTTAGYTVAS